MSYELSEDEKQGVLNAPDDKQYAYFVGKAADWGEVWVLKRGDDFGRIRDPDTDERTLAVWPHPGFAEDDLTGGWKAHKPAPIAIHRFLEMLRALDDEGRSVAILHQPDGKYMVMPAGALADDLLAALDEVQ